MSKFGKWAVKDSEKQIPLWCIVHLTKKELLTLINNMLVDGTVPENKTEIMKEAYKRILNKDFLKFKTSSANKPLAQQLFERYFPEYDNK